MNVSQLLVNAFEWNKVHLVADKTTFNAKPLLAWYFFL